LLLRAAVLLVKVIPGASGAQQAEEQDRDEEDHPAAGAAFDFNDFLARNGAAGHGGATLAFAMRDQLVAFGNDAGDFIKIVWGIGHGANYTGKGSVEEGPKTLQGGLAGGR
jgi:hypothetical protein